QRNIARLHRERFADWSLERYKSRIRMESGEEILEKWKEQVSRIRQYRVKSTTEPSPVEATADEPVEAAPVEEPAAEEMTAPLLEESVAEPDAPVEAAGEEAAPAEETPAVEPEAEPEPEDEAPAETPPKAEEGLVLKSIEEVARHFR